MERVVKELLLKFRRVVEEFIVEVRVIRYINVLGIFALFILILRFSPKGPL